MNTILLAVPGGMSIALIAIAILLLFGGKKIPQLMRGMGSGINEFKKGIKEGEGDAKKDEDKETEKLN
ncbi:MAG: twin-arginine translocase TatA/TatE family subunit [Flavobacteriales bacterium]|nr:MAG: twin-arginine translocase TatA/TatE family subunit [Flavobacteriales bacterium]